MKMKEKLRLLAGVAAIVGLVGCGSGSSADYDLGSGTGGTGITNIFSSPAEMGVGDIMPIELGGGEQVVDFDGVDPNAEFILVVGNAKQGGAGTSIQLSTDMMAPLDQQGKSIDQELLDSDEMTPDEVLSYWMRALEYDFAFNELPPEAPMTGKAMNLGKAVVEGDVRMFHMLDSLSSSTSHVDVYGEARCVRENVIFYVDIRNTVELDQNDINELCENFNADLADEIALYGPPSDTDGNGKMIVFASMQVNMLGSLGGGIITGYFYAGDLYPNGASNPVSNGGEIVYTMLPDPSGHWGVSVTKDFALDNLIPAVLVHETQHAISYNQHVFENGGAPEDPWLNEALSHFTEDYFALGNENPSRVSMFMSSTASTGLVASSTPNLQERGASYLFLRFLYEQHQDPDSFLRALLNTSLTGVDNLENAFGGSSDLQSFSQFMARWAVALAMTDRGLTSDSRYIYQPRTFVEATQNWQGVCLICDADDGRGTVLNGPQMTNYYGNHTATVDSSALKYYEITSVPDQIVLDGSGDATEFGILIRSL